MKKIEIKTETDLLKMIEGGQKLRRVKNSLRDLLVDGANAAEVEELAVNLIEKEGGQASFKMVPGYSWATCVNVNQGLVHGIPSKSVVFAKNDLVSVDVGMYYQGFHTDTSISVGIEPSREVAKFLEIGKQALNKAISQVKVGKKIIDISQAIQEVVETKGGYSSVRALVGHGVGSQLHMEPYIPCFVPKGDQKVLRAASPDIKPGMVIAIEVMYALGKPEIAIEKDGWTISMRDGKISGLFEETVAATIRGPLVLT